MALPFAEVGDDLAALALMDRPLGQTALFQRLSEEAHERVVTAATARNAFRSVVAMFGGLPGKGTQDAEGLAQLQQISTMMGHSIDVKRMLVQQADPSASLTRLKETYAAIVGVLGLTAERDDIAFFSVGIWQGEVWVT